MKLEELLKVKEGQLFRVVNIAHEPYNDGKYMLTPSAILRNGDVDNSILFDLLTKDLHCVVASTSPKPGDKYWYYNVFADYILERTYIGDELDLLNVTLNNCFINKMSAEVNTDTVEEKLFDIIGDAPMMKPLEYADKKKDLLCETYNEGGCDKCPIGKRYDCNNIAHDALVQILAEEGLL